MNELKKLGILNFENQLKSGKRGPVIYKGTS